MRTPNSSLLGGVGDGEFRRAGQELFRLIDCFAGIDPGARILDAGSGLGRVAVPLADRLDERGSYDGFDVCRRYVDWCRDELELDPERFRFHFLDVQSAMYNPAGAIAAHEVTLPWPDEHFTLTIASSLFTHLRADALRRYLGEIARTLVPGGRLFATFFVLDEQSLHVIRSGITVPRFVAPIEHGLTADAEAPEEGVAFEIDWLHAQFLECGFALEHYAAGWWRQAFGPTYQDLVVARRAR
jgi:SAM-dependent methyltransferase